MAAHQDRLNEITVRYNVTREESHVADGAFQEAANQLQMYAEGSAEIKVGTYTAFHCSLANNVHNFTSVNNNISVILQSVISGL